MSTTLKDLEAAAGQGLTGGGTLLPISDVIRLARHAHQYLAIFDKGTAIALYHTKRLAWAGQRIVLYAKKCWDCALVANGLAKAPNHVTGRVVVGQFPGDDAQAKQRSGIPAARPAGPAPTMITPRVSGMFVLFAVLALNYELPWYIPGLSYPVVGRRFTMVNRRWNESDEAKSSYVKELFSALATRYNVLTDVWTLGLHRVWKRQAMELCALRPGERVLDVATGTGDLALLEEAAVGPEGQVVAVDSCAAMLQVARGRQRGAIDFQEGDAMDLRFPDASFDVVTIGFGLRNVADRGQALREFLRVLRPGGRLMVLDFSTPNSKMLKVVHDLIYFVLMPAVGWAVAWHRDAHHYTSDSIRTWMSRDELSKTMLEAGFVDARYISLSTGFATVHFGLGAASGLELP